MKIYVVVYWHLSGGDEGFEVMGVFSTEGKAREYINKHKGYPANNDWQFVERELDLDSLYEER